MKITFKNIHNVIGTLKIEDDNFTLNEDVSCFDRETGKRYVPTDIVENFITVATEMSRFNGSSDVDFVKNIFNAFLTKTEKEAFFESIKDQD